VLSTIDWIVSSLEIFSEFHVQNSVDINNDRLQGGGKNDHQKPQKMNYQFITFYFVVAILPSVFMAYKIPKVGIVVALIYLYFVSGTLVESRLVTAF